MEKREDRVIVWLSAEEKDRLERISAEHCMKRGDVLRAAIMGTGLIEPPDEDLREIRRSLDRIESETEMLAYLAARDGFFPEEKTADGEDAFERLLDRLEGILGQLEGIREALPERR